MAPMASAVRATRFCMRTGIVFSRFFCFGQVLPGLLSFVGRSFASEMASTRLFRKTKRHCCPAAIVIDAGSRHYQCVQGQRLDRLKPNMRIGPRHPRLAGIGFRVAHWLAARTMGLAGFHQLRLAIRRSAPRACARQAWARRNRLPCRPRAHPVRTTPVLALVEVTQAIGPRLT